MNKTANIKWGTDPKNLRTGTKIILEKIEVKTGESSEFKPGEKRSGTLSQDCEVGHAVHFKEWGGAHVSSEIYSFGEEDGNIFLETRTSIYSVRIVTNDRDKEFLKWLNY
ncbi:MAG TPA: hypothetical protein VK153_02355 [Candidatus Paceibacterota bacterium]|nr:hypothetical protein [Candidatus Paceibacterota bacterium]